MSIIELKNVSFVYQQHMPDEHVAVNNVSLAVEKGEFVGIIGHTGSGKSTLIQLINGLLKPTQGEVWIDGKNIWAPDTDIRQVRFNVGLVMQYPEYQLFEETVYKDIAFGPNNLGLSEEDIHQRVMEAVDYLKIPHTLLEKSPFDLSGGEKRRVAIAGILAMKPKILILDEPTAGLDPAGRRDLLDLIENYHAVEHNTVLFVSHSMDDVARYSDRVLVMNQSSVYCFDTVHNVFSNSEQLSTLGLNIPTITSIILDLKHAGMNVDPSVYTVSDAVTEIMKNQS